MSDRILLEVIEHVAFVTLNRAAKLNALDLPLLEALHATSAALHARDDVRAVVICGAGESFCSGLDVASFADDPAVLQKAFQPVPGGHGNFVQHAFLNFRALPVPVICALHGRCFGGGLQLALAADIRICAPTAQLSIMEVRWGLVPDMGITQTAPGSVPLDVLKELTMTAAVVTGDEALALRLVTRLHDEPVAAARRMAETIASHSPDAIRAAKTLFEQAPGLAREEALTLEATLQAGLIGRPNQLEAIQANFAGRPAQFGPVVARRSDS